VVARSACDLFLALSPRNAQDAKAMMRCVTTHLRGVAWTTRATRYRKTNISDRNQRESHMCSSETFTFRLALDSGAALSSAFLRSTDGLSDGSRPCLIDRYRAQMCLGDIDREKRVEWYVITRCNQARIWVLDIFVLVTRATLSPTLFS